MRRIVLISPGNIEENMAGPAIRYWEFSKHLSKSFDVILLAPKVTRDSDDFVIEKLNNKNIWNYCRGAEVLIFQGSAMWKYPLLKYISTKKAIDLYDPFHLENLETLPNDPMGKLLYNTTIKLIHEQLKFGDYFFCASEKQRDYWLGMLTLSGRISVSTYHKFGKTADAIIGIVPFGIPTTMPEKKKKVMRGTVFGEKDKIVLWGGGIWNWLDPETLMYAMAEVKKQTKDIKCFFMGVEPPNGPIPQKLAKLLQLQKELQLNDTVYFNKWVPYDERHEYLLEADCGISLHHNHLETRFSFRTRILDYIWCRLPIVTNDGDVLSEIMKSQRIGTVLSSNDPSLVAEAIISITEDNQGIYPDEIVKSFEWNNAIRDLELYCESPTKTSPSLNLFGEIYWIMQRILYYSSRVYAKKSARWNL